MLPRRGLLPCGEPQPVRGRAQDLARQLRPARLLDLAAPPGRRSGGVQGNPGLPALRERGRDAGRLRAAARPVLRREAVCGGGQLHRDGEPVCGRQGHAGHGLRPAGAQRAADAGEPLPQFVPGGELQAQLRQLRRRPLRGVPPPGGRAAGSRGQDGDERARQPGGHHARRRMGAHAQRDRPSPSTTPWGSATRSRCCC